MNANYFSLRDSYVKNDECPGGTATDASSAYMSLRINGRQKAISHYYGCMDANERFKVYPADLVTLEKRIDEIVNTNQWMQ